MEIGCLKWISQGRQTQVYHLKCLATKYGRGTTNHSSSLLKPPSVGISVLARAWGKSTRESQLAGVSQSSRGNRGAGTNLRARPGKTEMIRGQGQSGRNERTGGPEENLLERWVLFNPIHCIPGTKDIKAASDINYVYKWTKTERERRKMRTVWFVGLSASWVIFFFLPLFRGLLILLQFCSGNKSKIYGDVDKDEKNFWKDVTG